MPITLRLAPDLLLSRYVKKNGRSNDGRTSTKVGRILSQSIRPCHNGSCVEADGRVIGLELGEFNDFYNSWNYANVMG